MLCLRLLIGGDEILVMEDADDLPLDLEHHLFPRKAVGDQIAVALGRRLAFLVDRSEDLQRVSVGNRKRRKHGLLILHRSDTACGKCRTVFCGHQRAMQAHITFAVSRGNYDGSPSRSVLSGNRIGRSTLPFTHGARGGQVGGTRSGYEPGELDIGERVVRCAV